MATIIDVAKQAGVSIKTVSRVLNRAPNVSTPTAERVRAAMSALDYTPSVAARELRSGRSHSIGLLLSDPSSGFQARLHHAALQACEETGYFLATGLFDESGVDWRGQVAEFLTRTRVEALVLVPPLCDSAALREELAEHDVAVVLIGPSEDAPGAHSVRIDDYRAAREITEHLLSLGHVKLGHLSGPDDHVASLQRRRGFIDAINNHPGAHTCSDWIRPGLFRFKDALAPAETILAGADRPTAIFAANDDTAAAVCFTAAQLGLRVPEDLSVAGFDDAPIATTLWPPLTTIAQPFEALAREVVALLAGSECAVSGPVSRTLPHSLQIRQSTAPPRNYN